MSRLSEDAAGREGSGGGWGIGNSAVDAAVVGQVPILAFGEAGIEW
jgi:hypothetical protein